MQPRQTVASANIATPRSRWKSAFPSDPLKPARINNDHTGKKLQACYDLRRFVDSESAMTLLILGLVLFLGIHTLTTVREPRAVLIGRLGEGPYKGLYSIVSAIGLVLIVWGLARYRDNDYLQNWSPPA